MKAVSHFCKQRVRNWFVQRLYIASDACDTTSVCEPTWKIDILCGKRRMKVIHHKHPFDIFPTILTKNKDKTWHGQRNCHKMSHVTGWPYFPRTGLILEIAKHPSHNQVKRHTMRNQGDLAFVPTTTRKCVCLFVWQVKGIRGMYSGHTCFVNNITQQLLCN